MLQKSLHREYAILSGDACTLLEVRGWFLSSIKSGPSKWLRLPQLNNSQGMKIKESENVSFPPNNCLDLEFLKNFMPGGEHEVYM